MLLFLPIELRVHDTMCIEFTLPSCTEPLKLEAFVRSRRGLAYGIEFTNATAMQQAAIEQTCRLLAVAH